MHDTGPSGAVAGEPRPDGAASLDELITRLRALRAWSGISYRELHRRLVRRRRSHGIPEEPAYATVYRCLQPGRTRLDVDLFVDIAAVLCNDEVTAALWRQAYAQLSGATATAYPAVLDSLPEDIGEFTGREAELALVLDRVNRWRQTGDAPGVLAIEGMAGVGKTTLAVHAARRSLENRRAEVTLSVNLCGYDPERAPVEPIAVLDGFLRQLGEPGARIQALDLDDRTARYRELLANHTALVLLDNAASEDQVRPLLPDSPSALVFVTSRHRVAIVRNAQHMPLEVFTTEQALGLLRRRAGTELVDTDPDVARRLVEQVGHLPLAVALLASRIVNAHGWTLGDHLEHLDERRDSLRLDAGVELAFATSYEALPPSQRRMLRLLALHPGRDCDAYAAAALAGTDLDAARRQLADLADGSLVSSRVPDRYELHDLVRIFAAGRARDDDAPSARRNAQTRLFDHYRWAATTAMDIYAPEERRRRPEIPGSGMVVPPIDDRPAAIEWLDVERPNLIAVGAYAAEHGWPEHTSDLSVVLARYLLIAAHYDDAAALHLHAVHVADGRAQGIALKNLGVVQWHRGDQGVALDRLQQALEIARAEADIANEPRVLVNIGNVFEHLGRYEDAIEVRKQALKILVNTGDRLGESRALQNLGTTYAWMGQFDKAVDHLERSLDTFRAVDDGNGESLAMENLGRLYLRMGECEKARQHHERAIALATKCGNRLALAEAETGLGSAQAQLGDLDSALQHHRVGLSIAREIGSRSSEAYAHNDLGATFCLLGRLDEALSHHREALTIAQSLGDMYTQATAHARLARACAASGDVDVARSHSHEALAIFTKLGTPEETDDVAANLAALNSAGHPATRSLSE